MTKIRKRLNQKGFTLVELMVVIAILGVLAAIAIPKFVDSTAAANTAKIAADLSTIDSAIVMYQANGNTVDDKTTVKTLADAGYLVSEPATPAGNYYLGGVKKSGADALTKTTGYSVDSTAGRGIVTGITGKYASDYYK